MRCVEGGGWSHCRRFVSDRGARDEPPFLTDAELLLAHEPRDAVLAWVDAFGAQGMHETRRTVGAAAGGKSGADLQGELLILALARAVVLAQVGMVAAAADLQGQAGFGQVHGR